jgi:hypothetical protein
MSSLGYWLERLTANAKTRYSPGFRSQLPPTQWDLMGGGK